MKIKIIETTGPNKNYTIEKVKREIGVNGEEPAGEYHRHTLEESDRIKRNSVQRHALKLEKEIKKVQVSYLEFFIKKKYCIWVDALLSYVWAYKIFLFIVLSIGQYGVTPLSRTITTPAALLL